MPDLTLTDRILKRFRRAPRGAVHTPKDFLDLGPRSSVGWVLHQLTRQGRIRRVSRGLYDLPRESADLDAVLSPDIERSAHATARRFRWRIIPDPARAANLLGLSQQVPAQIVYLSDGPSRSLRIGNREVHFKHARPKAFTAKSEVGALVIQALRNFGPSHVDDALLERLRSKLTSKDLARVLRDARYAANWIHEAVQRLPEFSS